VFLNLAIPSLFHLILQILLASRVHFHHITLKYYFFNKKLKNYWEWLASHPKVVGVGCGYLWPLPGLCGDFHATPIALGATLNIGLASHPRVVGVARGYLWAPSGL